MTETLLGTAVAWRRYAGHRPASPLATRLHMKALPCLLLLPALLTAQTTQPRLSSRSAPIIEKDGLRFRDLNRNGVVDAYEDWRLSPDARAHDLVQRMTLQEKA